MAVIPAAQLGASRFVSFDPDQGVLAAEAPDGTVQNLLAADPATGGVLHRSYGAGGPHVFHDGAGNPIATLSAAWIAAQGEVMFQGNRNVREWANLLHRPDVFPPSAHTHAFAEITGKPTTLAGYGITDALGASHTHALTDAAITGVLPVSKGGTGSGEAGAQGTVLVANGNGLAYARITDASVAPDAGIAWSKVSKTGAVAADVGALSQAAGDARYFPVTGGYLNGNIVCVSATVGTFLRLITSTQIYGSRMSYEDGQYTWYTGMGNPYAPDGAWFVAVGGAEKTVLMATQDRRVAIDPQGTLPTETLDVNGNARVRGSVVFADGTTQAAAAYPRAASDARYFPMTGGALNGNLVATSAGQGDIIRMITQVPDYGSNIRFEDGSAGTTWRVGINLVFGKTGVFHVGHVDTGHVALVASPNGWVAINPLSHTPAEALDVNGNVLVRGSVRFADGSLQGAAAYATAASDARYVLADALASGAVELPAEALAFQTSNGVVTIGVGGSVEAIHNGGPGTVLLGGTALGGMTGMAFGKVGDAHVTTLSWAKIAHPTTRDGYGITDVPTFDDLTTDGRAMITAGNILRPELAYGGVLIAGTDMPDLIGVQPVASWAASVPGKVLVGGVGAPFFSEIYDVHVAADAAIAWSKIDRSFAVLSDLGGTLAGVDALPTTGGTWSVGELQMTGTLSVGNLYAADLAVGGGRSFNSSDDLPSLSRYNVWSATNVFTTRIDALPAASFRRPADAQDRLHALPTGVLQWGNGTGQPDLSLYRWGPGTLGVTGHLNVGVALPVFPASGDIYSATDIALTVNGSATIGSLSVGSLSISGGSPLTDTSQIAILIAPNTWYATNLFEHEDGAYGTALAVRKMGTTYHSLQVNSLGAVEWGGGSADVDVSLYRPRAGALSVWGSLQVGASRGMSPGQGSGTSANTAAALEVTSTTRGFLPPRMTTTQRDAIATPPDGLIVYNSTTGKLNLREGGTWKSLTSA